MIRTYSELSTITSFKDRFRYLKLDGAVGEATFGFDRYLNQLFYRSQRWRKIRDEVIVRDCGCDLGIEGYEIYKYAMIHHMNPITAKDIQDESEYLLNPEYLITTTQQTHNAIHYGNDDLLPTMQVERTQNDTCPWRR